MNISINISIFYNKNLFFIFIFFLFLWEVFFFFKFYKNIFIFYIFHIRKKIVFKTIFIEQILYFNDIFLVIFIKILYGKIFYFFSLYLNFNIFVCCSSFNSLNRKNCEGEYFVRLSKFFSHLNIFFLASKCFL